MARVSCKQRLITIGDRDSAVRLAVLLAVGESLFG